MKYYCRTNTKEVAFCFCHLLFPGLMKAREGDLYLRNEELLNQLHQPIIGGAQGIFTISLDKPMGLGLTSDAAVDILKSIFMVRMRYKEPSNKKKAFFRLLRQIMCSLLETERKCIWCQFLWL